jgi:hypothetical protein
MPFLLALDILFYTEVSAFNLFATAKLVVKHHYYVCDATKHYSTEPIISLHM